MSNAVVVNKRTSSQYDVYIGRPSEWGNPYAHRAGTAAEHMVGSRDEAVEAYRQSLKQRIRDEGLPLIHRLAALHGKTLACWCAPLACHGDVLSNAAAWANEYIAVNGSSSD